MGLQLTDKLATRTDIQRKTHHRRVVISGLSATNQHWEILVEKGASNF